MDYSRRSFGKRYRIHFMSKKKSKKFRTENEWSFTAKIRNNETDILYNSNSLFGTISVKQRQNRLKCSGSFYLCCKIHLRSLMITVLKSSLQKFMNQRVRPEGISDTGINFTKKTLLKEFKIEMRKLKRFSTTKSM